MLLLDLAVPRDIEPAVRELKDAFLYTIDDLERAVEDNRRSRREAADAAAAIVELQVARFVEAQQASGPVEPAKRLRAPGRSARDHITAKPRQQPPAGHDAHKSP